MAIRRPIDIPCWSLFVPHTLRARYIWHPSLIYFLTSYKLFFFLSWYMYIVAVMLLCCPYLYSIRLLYIVIYPRTTMMEPLFLIHLVRKGGQTREKNGREKKRRHSTRHIQSTTSWSIGIHYIYVMWYSPYIFGRYQTSAAEIKCVYIYVSVCNIAVDTLNYSYNVYYIYCCGSVCV